MNEEKTSTDMYWEKVSDMIEEAKSKYMGNRHCA